MSKGQCRSSMPVQSVFRMGIESEDQLNKVATVWSRAMLRSFAEELRGTVHTSSLMLLVLVVIV